MLYIYEGKHAVNKVIATGNSKKFILYYVIGTTGTSCIEWSELYFVKLAY